MAQKFAIPTSVYELWKTVFSLYLHKNMSNQRSCTFQSTIFTIFFVTQLEITTTKRRTTFYRMYVWHSPNSLMGQILSVQFNLKNMLYKKSDIKGVDSDLIWFFFWQSKTSFVFISLWKRIEKCIMCVYHGKGGNSNQIAIIIVLTCGFFNSIFSNNLEELFS